MPNRTIKEIESYNYSQHNPIEDIKEKLKQLGYKVQPEILDQQNLNNFSRHLITFGNSDNAFDISIHRVDNNRYEVLAGELNKEEKHDLLLKIEAFQNIFVNTASYNVNNFVDSMIKNNEKSHSLESLSQSFLEHVSNKHVEELEKIKLPAEYKFAIKKQVLEDFEFNKRFEDEIKKKESSNLLNKKKIKL
tara:strand:- start:474 stop:1046 length:573 start_codon:yes stop_codon:yes gene_type:complete